MSHSYAKFTPNDFDKFDCVKLSKVIYLVLIFVLRAYVVWMMTVTNMRDRVGVIEWIYPDPALFYLGLLSGAIGVFVLLLISLRRPDAPNWVKICWRHLREILLLALVFDLVINLVAFSFWQLLNVGLLIGNSVLVLLFAVFLYRSNKVTLNINEFPEKLPEK